MNIHLALTVYLALNEALNVPAEERTLSSRSGSQLCLGPVSQEGRTRAASSFLTELEGPYI